MCCDQCLHRLSLSHFASQTELRHENTKQPHCTVAVSSGTRANGVDECLRPLCMLFHVCVLRHQVRDWLASRRYRHSLLVMLLFSFWFFIFICLFWCRKFLLWIWISESENKADIAHSTRQMSHILGWAGRRACLLDNTCCGTFSVLKMAAGNFFLLYI